MNFRSGNVNDSSINPHKRTSPCFITKKISSEKEKDKTILKSAKKLDGNRQIFEHTLSKIKINGIPYIGASDFKVLREKGFFIDKTSFIREFLQCEFLIIAALFPRRFGKSTNLNMVKTFLELELDKNGKELDHEKRTTPSYYLGGKIKNSDLIFESLEISNDKEIVQKFLGNYPTIYIDLKAVRDGNDFESMESSLNECIYNVYRQHFYLANSSNLRKSDKIYFKEIIDSRVILNKNISNSLRFLSELLKTHWNRKTFVFIDEYDAPIHYMFGNENFKRNNIQDVIGKLSSVFSNLLKSNDSNIEKALITGILHVEEAGFLSELNNLKKLTCEKPEFAKNYYGFTKKDIELLFKVNQIDFKLMDQIKEWYNGYLFGNVEIYNPWAIVQCVRGIVKSNGDLEQQKNSFQNFWEKSGNLENLINLFRFSDVQVKIKKLIDNHLVDYPNIHIGKKNYQDLIELARNNTINFEKSSMAICDIFLQILFYTGYLTLTSDGKIKIPNREIREEFRVRLRSFFVFTYKIDFDPTAFCLVKLFEPQNQNLDKSTKILKEFCKIFDEILKICPPFLDIKIENSKDGGIHPNEDIVHSLLNVICLQIADRIYWGTEIHCYNQQRCDIMMICKKEKYAAIIEVKFAKSAEEALDQIIDLKYIRGLPENLDIKKKLLIGLNITKEKRSEFIVHI